ncbi:MAG: DUF3575 domain-containing protein [Alistipes sp.]|jgi:hypothetical protein|nr:DUF3575 domain-containing protein [Alistipes sp.]
MKKSAKISATALIPLAMTVAMTVIAMVASTTTASAQMAGVKTNLLYWGTGTINVGVEAAVGPKTTLGVELTGNPWVFGKRELNRKIWHWSATPEIRFWSSEAFDRGFVGIHAVAGAFDAGGIEFPLGILPNLKDHRYEGWTTGVGVSYGWQWWIGPRWNLEATVGVGYLYAEYNRFACPDCREADEENKVEHYFGPTKVGLSFAYLFGSKKR